MTSYQKKALKDLSKPLDADAVCEARSTYELMPWYKDIPKEFKNWNNSTIWNKFQSDWFFLGLENTDGLIPKEGIDPRAALMHLAAIQRSYEPAHEEKEASVAYLASLWFDDKSTWVVCKKKEKL